MHGIQNILVIGGLALLTSLILTFNNSRIHKTEFILENETIFTGTGIGQSLLDVIQTKSFDEQTISKSFTSPDSLTPSGSLGTDASETSESLYDDIDDYNNFTKTDSLGVLGNFSTKIKVYYINKLSPETKSSTPTFSKRIDIYITGLYLSDTIKLNNILTY